MLRVMKKDLILNRSLILINGVIFLACLTYFAANTTRTPPLVYAGFASFMMAFLPSVMVTREDKFDAMTLGCSLPVSRKTIVQARFVLSLVMGFLGIFGAFVFATLLPLSSYRAADLFAPGPVLTGVSGISIVLAVLLPFTLRFGMKGILIFLVSAQVLGVVLFTLVQVSGSGVDRRIVEGIAGSVVRFRDALGPPGFNLVLVTSLAALLALSYLVSVWAFERREL